MCATALPFWPAMKRTLVITSLFMLLLAFPALAAEKITFTIVGIDCEECSAPILKKLQSLPGVTNATLRWKEGSATVEVPSGYDRERLRKAMTDLGFEAIFPGEKRKDIEPVSEAVLKTLDITTDVKGAKINEKKIAVAGKITIVDLYADWCGPCKVLETRLHNYMTKRSDLALRRVNVGKWDTAAAKQATREFRAEALPYIRVYDAKGKFVASVTGGAWDQVLAALEKAQASTQKAKR
jgi:copper chaperone CopZ